MNQPAQPPLQILRIPVDKPAPAVEFLRTHGHGVMDLIAHFWERLAQTPPLLRQDLHLVAAVRPNETTAENAGHADNSAAAKIASTRDAKSANPVETAPISSSPSPPAAAAGNNTNTANNGNDKRIDSSIYEHISNRLAGVMLYVPKAYRADVLAPTQAAAETFANYILSTGTIPAQPPNTDAAKPATQPRCAIDFLTGGAEGVDAMVPLLLPAVSNKKSPARTLVNVVMHLPPEIPAALDPIIRPAGVGDLPALNRWRRLYKEERGILFDADMDAWVESQKVFVAEHEGQIAAAAKFDLELSTLIEIGGVYTFPEFRNHGFAQRIMNDLAARIRAGGKTPTLQVDETNAAAADLYHKMGWKSLGRLGRVWLTDG